MTSEVLREEIAIELENIETVLDVARRTFPAVLRAALLSVACPI